ncbi:MAG: glycosyltransferase [Desmonostoc vinosum HA7617-LM4]|jgi:UDP:flavonoid glycosyltransferase YjiC (YdhE family)|nr:glycosyltransferase [Desmonostoc vinosum HA7617-LM4]
MHITILTWGSTGDVQPYIALGLGLQKAGHLVRLATRPDYRELVGKWGLEFISIDCKAWYRDYADGFGQNPFVIANFYKQSLQPIQDSVLPLLYDVCHDADAIIFSPPAFPAFELVEKLGIPGYAACVSPLHQTYMFPNHFTRSNQSWAGVYGIYNWLTYPFFNQLFWQHIRQPINQWREQILGLPPVPLLLDFFSRMNRQQLPFLYGYSPAFLPKPADWPDWVDVTGYWFLDSPQSWQPPTELAEFLAAGSPPVYIGFGNKGGWKSANLTKLVLEALSISQQRGILLIGEDLDGTVDLPDEVFPIEWVPFDWLLPRTMAVVHHGGIGTIAAALRAGVPSIVVPYNYENYFWAHHLAESGLGPPLITRNHLCAESLAAAIKIAINNKTMRNRVVEMSKKIQAENGVARAVKVFHQHYFN